MEGPIPRFFLNFEKSRSYHAYHNSIIKNGGHQARFWVISAKAKMKGVFSKSCYCYGNLLFKRDNFNFFPIDRVR